MPRPFGQPHSTTEPMKRFGRLKLHQLTKGSVFRLVEGFADAEVVLSVTGRYRVVSTMADSGRTIVLEELVPSATSSGTLLRRDGSPARISRERAKTIEVYKLRQP